MGFVKNIFVFIIMMITVSAAAQQVFMINSGDFGIAGNIPLNDNHSQEITFSVLNIGIEDRRTNLGFEFSPFKYNEWKNTTNGEKNTAYSLANFSLYWNIFNYESSAISFYFGPFASINYFFVENNVNWNKFIFTGGAQIGLRVNSDRLKYKIVSLELGYRNIDGKSKYYIGAKFDMAVSIISVIYIAAEAHSD